MRERTLLMPIPLTQMQAAQRILSELTERARATDDPVHHMQADCLLVEMLADAAYKSAYIGRWDQVEKMPSTLPASPP